jgi:hypothetical protein
LWSPSDCGALPMPNRESSPCFWQRLSGAGLGVLGGALYGGVGGMGVACLLCAVIGLVYGLASFFVPGGGLAGFVGWFVDPPLPFPPLPGLSPFENLLLLASGVLGAVAATRGLAMGFWWGPHPVKVVNSLSWGVIGGLAGAGAGCVLWAVWPVPNPVFHNGALVVACVAGLGVMVAGMAFGTRHGPV